VKWLAKTHSVEFELVRHFLRRMFDSEWSSSPGQWRSAAVGAFSLFLPAGLLLIREGSLDFRYGAKYRLLAMAGRAADIRAASLADELALITLLLCVTGLIALLEWQSLFPSGRDYLALASLPVRSRQIFTARLASVLIFSAAIVIAVNLLPSLIAPAEFGGGWRFDASYWSAAGAQALASGAACFFVFFAILALQGILLNVLPAGIAARVSIYAQGLLAGAFLLGGFYSWTIKEWSPEMIAKLPAFGAWLPPVWFTCWHQMLTGAGDPFSLLMARRAGIASATALLLAFGTYLLCYRRYRKLFLETPVRLATPGIRRLRLIRLLARSPRREAVMDFMAKTLARSRAHRLLWLVYLGATAAVLLNGSLIDGAIVMKSGGWNKALEFLVLFWPLACSVIVLNGFRHVLSIPMEWRANWIFQIAESQGRAEWMSAVERFAMAYAIAPIYLILFPVAVYCLGWPLALRMTALQLLISLSIFELLFYSWQKLPFTCSYIPGQKPPVVIVGQYIAMLCAMVPMLTVIIAIGCKIVPIFPFYFAMFTALWIWLRARRREGWGEAKLLYEDGPAVVTDLGIKELTYAGIQAQLRRTDAGDAGHADTENPDSRPDAWLRGGGVHSADVGGRVESGGGRALPSAAPAGAARPIGGRMGNFGQQPAGEILSVDSGGPPAPGGRNRALATDVGRDRADHGTGLGEVLTGPWLRLRALFHRRQLDRDLEDELAFHLTMREENGLDTVAARRRFGNPTSIKEACRDMWTFGWIEAFWQDVRYGCRQLRTDRGFAIVTAITLSFGIAATTTIYSLCDVFVWKTLPLADPDTLVAVLNVFPGNPHLWQLSTPADVDDIRKSQTLLSNMASWERGSADIVDAGGEPLLVDQARVTANFFDVVGVSPVLGRSFLPGEDQPGRDRVAIMSDRLWRARFQADPGVVGRILRLNDLNYTIIGVMAPKFAFPRPAGDLWTPLTFTPEERASRSDGRIDSFGRLRPGHTVRQVQSELDGLALRLEKLYPQTNTKRRFLAWPVHRYVAGDYAMGFLNMLLGAALFVLLIACVNVANLQFARGTARFREVALRQALGASRWRTVAQLVTESVILSLAGALLGIVLAHYGLRAIREGLPVEVRKYAPAWSDLRLNAHALAFALAAAVLSGIVAGLAPALRSSRPNLTEALKEGGHASSAGPGRHRLRSALLVAETALTVVLLVGAGLMVRGFQNVLAGDTAIEPATLLTLKLDLGATSHRTPEQVVEFYRQVVERMAALPGVEAAAAVSAVPFNGHERSSGFAIQGRELRPGDRPAAQLQAVSPDYFRTLRIPLRAGRLLSGRDGPRTAPVAVVSEEMARQWWPAKESPIGQQIKLGTRDSNGPWITIVGVVGGIRASILDRVSRPAIYVPYVQHPESAMDIAMRVARDPLTLAAPARMAIKAVDSEQPVDEIMTVQKRKQNQAISFTYMASLMGIFGVFALLLSCVGIYGMTAYVVAQQSHEIGIRMALGAGAWTVLRMFLLRGSRAALAGLVIGLVFAFGLARLLAAIIWGVSATDVRTFAAVPLLLILATGLAIYIPTRRAVRVDPMVALRNE
jgi:putative ABC transport system permease protein